jgi:hypothetical protein
LLIGFLFFPADPFGFVRFLLVVFLAIRAVYHRHTRSHETELDAKSARIKLSDQLILT